MSTQAITQKEKLFKRFDSLNFDNIKKQAKTPLLFLLGMWGGNQVIVYLNKKMGDYKVTTVLGLKPEVASAVIGGLTGLALSTLANDENFKVIGYGVAGQGMLKTLTASSPRLKELLSGIGDDSSLTELENQNHYLIAGPSEALELNLEDMDQAMQIIDNAVAEETIKGTPTITDIDVEEDLTGTSRLASIGTDEVDDTIIA